MQTQLSDFVNLQTLTEDLIIELTYATPNNFTGQVVYDFTTAIARRGSAQKLAEASKILKKQGYRIKVWDAYRPVSAQLKLFEVYPDPTFVAKPNPNFSHQKGVTFDVTLTDLAGKELVMPTAFDDFSEKAKRSSKHLWSPEALANYNLLNDAMTQAGFIGYPNEWWDFRDSQMDEYGPSSANPNDY